MPSTRSIDNLLECGANKGISYICYEADLQYKNLKKLTKKRLICHDVLHPYPTNKKIKIADTNIPEPAVHLPPHSTVALTNIPEPAVHLPSCPAAAPTNIPEPAVHVPSCPAAAPTNIPEPDRKSVV